MSGVVSWAKLGSSRVTYYENTVADGRESYYAGAGEAAGRWMGEGARLLGLDGELTDGQLTRMANGQHPTTGAHLREANGTSSPVGAFDFTFSAPKTISLLYASGDRELSSRMFAAHDCAVASAIRFLETEGAFVRRGKGGVVHHHAEGLVGAAYRHRTSRAGDPQLHTHAIVANWACGPDGRHTALNTVRLRDCKMAMGALYAAELRANAAELGLSWRPLNRKGLAELDCIDNSALRKFSNRRSELERDANGSQDSAAAMAGAALSTRRAKRKVDMPAIERDVAATLGDRLIASIRARTDGRHRVAERVAFDADALAGPRGLTHMANTFSRNDVIIAVARGASQGMYASDVIELTDRFLARADVVHVNTGRYTTVDLLEAERARERAQLGRADTLVGLAMDRALRRGTRGLSLNPGQRAVVEAVFRSGNGVDVVEAQAGTGKTHTMAAIRRVAEEDGRRVIGTAPTGRAARELESQAGIESCTVDSLLRKLDRGDVELTWKHVLVVDEAGLLATRPGARLERHAADAGAKVVEIGDHRQLQSVLAGGELPGVHEALGGLRLDEVVRQRDPQERRALGQLHAGNPGAYLEHQEANKRVTYGSSLERAVDSYMRHAAEVGFRQTAFVVPTNALADAANELVRERRRGAGELGTQARLGELEVAQGDRVICRLNDGHLQVCNGDRATVTRVHGLGLDIELDGGQRRHIPPGYVEEGHLRLGYAGTVHTHQGITVEQTVIAGRPDELYSELAYVAASRSRDRTDLHVITGESRDEDRVEIGPVSEERARDQREELVRTMRASRAEQLAIEQLSQDHGFDLGLER